MAFQAGSTGLASVVLDLTTKIEMELLRANGPSVQSGDPTDVSSSPGEKKLQFHFPGVSDAQLVAKVRLRRDQPIQTDIRFNLRVASGVLDREPNGRIRDLGGAVINGGTTFGKGDDHCDVDWVPASEERAAVDAARHDYQQYLAAKQGVDDENARRTASFLQLQRNVKNLQRLILRRRHFFTRVILNAVEPEEIIQLLEALRLRFGDGPHDVVALSTIAHTVPLGSTVGGFVLRLKPLDSLALDRLGLTQSSNGSLKQLVNYAEGVLKRFDEAHLAKRDISEQVFLPTGGLFAEAVLGRSNAAEYLDIERYFNWQDAPIPNLAPGIQPLDTGSRYQVPTAQTAAAPSTINLTGPVTLPDPTGMQGVLSAIQNGNMFRDMSKAGELAGIVGNLANLSGQMGQAATKLAGDAQQQAMQAAVQVGQAAATLAQAMGSQAFQQAGAVANSMTQQGAMLNQARKVDAGKSARAAGSGAGGQGGGSTSSGSGSGTPGSGGPGPASPGSDSSSPLQVAQAGSSDMPLEEQVLRQFTRTSGGDAQLATYNPNLPLRPSPDVQPILWRDLIQYRVPQDILDLLASRDMRSPSLAGAARPHINLDAFPVRITAMPTDGGVPFTAASLLRHVRLNINDFLSSVLGEFSPYDEAIDGPVWRSDAPRTAVLKIDLLGPDNAAVVCTEADADHWIFNTVRTPVLPPGTGTHPVSGQRMFGYLEHENGDVTIYTRGADRATGYLDSLIEEQLYLGGAAFWVEFQYRLIKFVRDNGGEAELSGTFSRRFPWIDVQRQVSAGLPA